VSGFFTSFISQMRPAAPASKDLAPTWNDAQAKGQLKTADYKIDLGSVIPSALATLDVPDLLALVAPRPVLFCQLRDGSAPDAEVLRQRLLRVTGAAGNSLRYDPDRQLDGRMLRDWVQNGGVR
jgi:hypothetical protein